MVCLNTFFAGINLNFRFDISYIIQILSGLQITMSVFVVALVLSLPLGIVVALCRLSKIAVLRKLMEVYIWILRGTPLLLQIIFVFFGLPIIGIKFGRLPAVYVAFVLNYTAYFGEIFRSGIQSIERGQVEAASILGFSSWQIYQKIILPQVVKRTLPSIGNEVISLVKDTALVHVVGVSEILKVAKGIANRDVTLVPYVIAGAIFLMITYIITKLFDYIESRVNYEE